MNIYPYPDVTDSSMQSSLLLLSLSLNHYKLSHPAEAQTPPFHACMHCTIEGELGTDAQHPYIKIRRKRMYTINPQLYGIFFFSEKCMQVHGSYLQVDPNNSILE